MASGKAIIPSKPSVCFTVFFAEWVDSGFTLAHQLPGRPAVRAHNQAREMERSQSQPSLTPKLIVWMLPVYCATLNQFLLKRKFGFLSLEGKARILFWPNLGLVFNGLHSFMPLFISPNVLPCFCACFFWAILTLCHYKFFLATHFCCKVAHVFALNFLSIRSAQETKAIWMITWLLHDLRLLIGSVLIQITTESGEFVKPKHPKTVVFKNCFSVRIASTRSYISCMIPVCWFLRSIYRRSHFFSRFLSPFVFKPRFLEQINL